MPGSLCPRFRCACWDVGVLPYPVFRGESENRGGAGWFVAVRAGWPPPSSLPACKSPQHPKVGAGMGGRDPLASRPSPFAPAWSSTPALAVGPCNSRVVVPLRGGRGPMHGEPRGGHGGPWARVGE
jgi:hypothetical protein